MARLNAEWTGRVLCIVRATCLPAKQRIVWKHQQVSTTGACIYSRGMPDFAAECTTMAAVAANSNCLCRACDTRHGSHSCSHSHRSGDSGAGYHAIITHEVGCRLAGATWHGRVPGPRSERPDGEVVRHQAVTPRPSLCGGRVTAHSVHRHSSRRRLVGRSKGLHDKR